jgi:predicted RNase H-like nuclease (RuvC/YqgF family)
MKLKQKPRKPIRKTNYREYIDTLYYDGTTVADLLRKAKESVGYPVEPEDILIERDYEYISYYFVGDEPLESFDARMKKYEKRLAEYKAWYQINKTEADAELEARKARATTNRQIDKEVERLKKQIRNLTRNKL